MTRSLTNEFIKSELTRKDLNMAKEVLRHKCLIGLREAKAESFYRFERYVGFELKDSEQKSYKEKELRDEWPLNAPTRVSRGGTPMWNIIMAESMLGMEVYDNARLLFDEQAALFQPSILSSATTETASSMSSSLDDCWWQQMMALILFLSTRSKRLGPSAMYLLALLVEAIDFPTTNLIHFLL